MTQNFMLTTTLWIVATFMQLQSCMADSSSLVQTNTTSNVNRGISTQRSSIPRRLPSPWRHAKYPVLPPRLRSRHQHSTTSTTPAPSTTTPKPSSTTAVSTTQEILRRRMDIFESSSSDNNPLSVVWPLRRRPAASKRFRAPTPTTPTPRVLLKLLQPKPTRPAIYSLDGFVPKPSIQKIVTTEAPLHLRKTDLQALSSVTRRRKINRFNREEDFDEDYPTGNEAQGRRKKPVSSYTAFARKGVPGEDYPVFGYIPQTDFECGTQPGPGLYADPYTDCQVWHMCPGGSIAPRHSFLCPNGTIFNQKKRICDWWYNVGCGRHSRSIRSSLSLFPPEAMNNNLNDDYDENWDTDI